VSPPLELRFVTSADRVEALPDARTEVAVVGRSNVGKSSLLNALAGRKGLANTSKTPGRTQLLNCFAVVDGDRPPDQLVVDCPGYGYAAVSKTTRAAWGRMIDRYLLEREPLTMVLALVDGEIGPTTLDVLLLDWLQANGLPHTVIATKHDKVKASRRDARKRDLAAACGLLPADVVWVSALKGVGIDRLRDLVRLWLA
jgi:GTP-binding protein